jgi:hypothetical protein
MFDLLRYRIRFERTYIKDMLNPRRIKVGSIYEDCNYDLCVATVVDIRGDYLLGIRIKDGVERGCSPAHCTTGALTPTEVAFKIKESDND